MINSNKNNSDWRNISNGLNIPTISYCDQPYIIRTDDDAWLCCITTGKGHEGDPGQHVTTMRSFDCGKSWSNPVPVERPGDVENSYASMLKTPSGRVYIFYNHNTDNVREIKRHDGKGTFPRVDSLGYFVFKFSDDNGKSWSNKRYNIPVRLFKCDRENVYKGKLCFFWNVGKPFTYDGAAFVSLHKVGQMGVGFYQQSEGILLKSNNILAEPEPEKIHWETLPDGEVGLKTPLNGGMVSEEQSYVVLSDGSFYVNYRSIDGYPVESYSRDGGHSWSSPQYKCFADGSRMKHPRAANFVWKCKNGKYLYWFHNHGGHFICDMHEKEVKAGSMLRSSDGNPYNDRNPAWLCGGVEVDSPEGKIIKWSQPEIVLYDDNPLVRISYPDLIEENGKYYLTETQKLIARVHKIPSDFINQIWDNLEMILHNTRKKVKDNSADLLLDKKNKTVVEAPELPEFFMNNPESCDQHGKVSRNGFALELIITVKELKADIIINGMRGDGRGIALCITPKGCLELIMNDGWMEHRMNSEPCLKPGKTSHIVINVDGGPQIVSFIVNGYFCDGGEHRQFGWSRFSPQLRHVNWSGLWNLGSKNCDVKQIKVYKRPLMTAEAQNNCRISRISKCSFEETLVKA